jgi:uncharacterized protein (DUF1501 family)
MTQEFDSSRRRLLRAGLAGLSLRGAGAAGLGGLFGQATQALAASQNNDRILVVLELSGGNDGLNTLVPYGDDAYYRHRPTIGIAANKLRKLDDHWGLSPGMAGFERLYKDGKVAVLHGCGYDNPSFSHFTSMAYWHTAAPNSGGAHGWVGGIADRLVPAGAPNPIINIDTSMSLAVTSSVHTPVVFDEPERFIRRGFFQERALLNDAAPLPDDSGNASRRFLRDVAVAAKDASTAVREAWSNYKTPVDYGIVPVYLQRVAAMINAGFPTRLYYVAYRNNAFDTHVVQPDVHARLLTYVSDALHGFMKDLERLGQGDRVSVLVFSEFGRRVPENANLGTDHGTANNVFVVGKQVLGGHYGKPVSLTALDPGDNLVHTTDFRRAYASVIDGWLGLSDTRELLHGAFDPFPLFRAQRQA